MSTAAERAWRANQASRERPGGDRYVWRNQPPRRHYHDYAHALRSPSDVKALCGSAVKDPADWHGAADRKYTCRVTQAERLAALPACRSCIRVISFEATWDVDEVAVSEAMAGCRRSVLSRAELMVGVRRLTERGVGAERSGVLLGVHSRTVVRYRRKLREGSRE